MADKLREAASWRKQKTPLVREYAKDHGKLLSEIAGRGFLNLPGYAYDMENELELRLKLGLSEINYKILSETIERELKQAGITYDLAYKTAAIAWEVEKQSLLAAWDAEYAGIKRGMAADEEVVTRLAIEVGRRAITLIEQKTIIETAMEGYKADLAGLEALVSPYEVQLANAKLLTAQSKLAIIPILQEIVAKELELIAIEQEKAAAYEGLMDAERELATKKQSLIAPLAELTTVINEYIAKIPTQIMYEGQIADEKLAQAQSIGRRAALRIIGLNSEIANEYKEIEVKDAKRDLTLEQLDNENQLKELEIDKEETYQNDLLEHNDTIIDIEQEGLAKIIAAKTQENATNNEIKVDHSHTINSQQDYVSTLITNEEIRKAETLADLEAAATITANLRHLIG
jgi:hypothetical protein